MAGSGPEALRSKVQTGAGHPACEVEPIQLDGVAPPAVEVAYIPVTRQLLIVLSRITHTFHYQPRSIGR